MSFLCYELIIFDLNPDLLSRSIRTFAFFSSWIMWVRVLEYSDTTKCAVLFLLVVVTKCTNNCWKLFHAAHLPTKSRQKSKVSFLFSTQRMNSLSFTNRPRTLTRPDAYYFLTILHILYVLYFPGFICISSGRMPCQAWPWEIQLWHTL